MAVLLAIMNRAPTARPVLVAAGLVARRWPGPRIDVLHVRPVIDPDFMASEEVMTPRRQALFDAECAAQSAALKAAFDVWRKDGVTVDAAWREETGVPAAVIAREGGQADLIIVGRADERDDHEGHAVILAALFEARAPIVLITEHVPLTLGAHIAVAWKPGDAAERAVQAALPLLQVAERVTVLVESGPGGQVTGPLALGDAWPRRDHVQTVSFALAGESIGPALLREARLLGADLLVMGAYAHCRSVEAVFGGATSEILAQAGLPVLMQH